MSTPSTLPQQTPGRRAKGEQGFAFLTIIFLAAALLIGLALSLPRAAMQAQRLREERLIYRGEQYKRAIELYFRAHKKYPSDLDDLEERNGVRYLRQRYKDPMNENEEWRFIRMGSDGRFKDSLIHDLEDPTQQGQGSGMGQRAGMSQGIGQGMSMGGRGGSQSRGGFGSQQPYSGYGGAYQPPPVPDGRFRGADRAREVRESAAPEVIGTDRPLGWVPGQTPAPQYDENGNPIPPPSAEQGDPNQPQEGQYPGYSRMRPGQIPNQAEQGSPGGQQPNQQSRNARAANRIGGAPASFGGITTPDGAVGGMPTGAMPGGGPQAIGGQAVDVIRGILTSPRPGGLAGLRNNQRAQSGGSVFKGGIAGVATKAQEMGVKLYEGREMYHEWEFVYDYRQDAKLGGAGGPGAAGLPGATQSLSAGQPGTTPSGTLGGVPGGGAFPPGYPAGGPTEPGIPNPRGRQRNNPYGGIQTGPGGIQTTPQPGAAPQPGVPLPGTTPGIPQPQNPNQPRNPNQQQPQPGVVYGPDGTSMPRRLR